MFGIIQSTEDVDTDRLIASRLKREVKLLKSRSTMDTARDLVLKASSTVSRRITLLEDGSNGVVQHEKLMTEDERIRKLVKSANEGPMQLSEGAIRHITEVLEKTVVSIIGDTFMNAAEG